MTVDERAWDACERMTQGGMVVGVLCHYGDRRLPVNGYINVGGKLLDVPVPAIASTDVRLVAIAEPPLDFGITGGRS